MYFSPAVKKPENFFTAGHLLCWRRFSESDAEVGKQMSLWNAVRSAYLEAADFPFSQNSIGSLCADTEYFTHLADVHYIGVFLEHELVGITLINY